MKPPTIHCYELDHLTKSIVTLRIVCGIKNGHITENNTGITCLRCLKILLKRKMPVTTDTVASSDQK